MGLAMDQDKSKQQLIGELERLRRRVAELEANDRGGESDTRPAPAATQGENERESSRLQAILSAAIECLPFEFFAVGLDGRYILQNAVSRQHFGDAIGKRPEDVCCDEATRQLWLDCNRRAFAGERVKGEVHVHVDGETRTYCNIVSPIQDYDRISGILGVNVDLTERKQAEEALPAKRVQAKGHLGHHPRPRLAQRQRRTFPCRQRSVVPVLWQARRVHLGKDGLPVSPSGNGGEVRGAGSRCHPIGPSIAIRGVTYRQRWSFGLV